MANKKILISALIMFFFILFYLVFAARPLGKEYHYEPEWETNILNSSDKPSGKDTYFFKLENKAGYFDVDGTITKLITFPEGDKVSISEEYYATYPVNAENTDFFDQNGTLKGTIKEAGFPYFSDDRIFLFLTDGCSVSRYDSQGNLLWTYYGVMPVTAFASKKTSTAIGLADGTIKVFDTQSGELKLQYAPGGSDNPVILGLDISSDSQYIASVSGRNQQRFVLTHREGNQQKVIYHKFLDSDSPYRTSVYFTKDNKRVFYNNKSTVSIYDIEKNKNYDLNIKDKVISIRENDNFVYILTKNKNTYTVYLITNTNSIEGSFAFEAQSAFIQCDEDHLYVGKDTSISCLSINRE